MLGTRIRTRRTELGLSQRQLAGKELTRAFISMVESGRAHPSERSLQIIADRLGLPVEHFRDDAPPAHAGDDARTLEAIRRFLDHGDPEVAIALLKDFRRRTSSQYLEAEAGCTLAACLRRTKRFDEARDEAEAALHDFLELRDPGGVVRSYLELGSAAFEAEDFPAARRAYEGAIRSSSLLKSLLPLWLMATIYLGTTRMRLGDLPGAFDTYGEALKVPELSADPEQHGQVLMGMGKVLYQSGRLDESLEWTRRAVTVLEQAGSANRVLALHNLAVVRAALGDDQVAYVLFQQCLRVYEAEGRVGKQASVLEDLACYWLSRGHLVEARECCERALELLDLEDSGEVRGRLYRVQGRILQALGAPEGSYHFLRMSYDLFRRIRSAREADLSRRAMMEAGRPPGLRT